MGVKDLWKLLEPVGHPVSPDDLKGLVLAVGEAKKIFKLFLVRGMYLLCWKIAEPVVFSTKVWYPSRYPFKYMYALIVSHTCVKFAALSCPIALAQIL